MEYHYKQDLICPSVELTISATYLLELENTLYLYFQSPYLQSSHTKHVIFCI